MKVGKKYLCKNGFIANIKSRDTFGGFGGTYEDEKGNILYNSRGFGWSASYDKNGSHPNDNLKVIKEFKNQ